MIPHVSLELLDEPAAHFCGVGKLGHELGELFVLELAQHPSLRASAQHNAELAGPVLESERGTVGLGSGWVALFSEHAEKRLLDLTVRCAPLLRFSFPLVGVGGGGSTRGDGHCSPLVLGSTWEAVLQVVPVEARALEPLLEVSVCHGLLHAAQHGLRGFVVQVAQHHCQNVLHQFRWPATHNVAYQLLHLWLREELLNQRHGSRLLLGQVVDKVVHGSTGHILEIVDQCPTGLWVDSSLELVQPFVDEPEELLLAMMVFDVLLSMECLVFISQRLAKLFGFGSESGPYGFVLGCGVSFEDGVEDIELGPNLQFKGVIEHSRGSGELLVSQVADSLTKSPQLSAKAVVQLDDLKERAACKSLRCR
mmetsp:Transcript_13477/g.39242  ORF Transcript_13477/g.39242 Transcript_13477/m.39242 type:complete len:365 (-) Transcript_13477:129-1223(-)